MKKLASKLPMICIAILAGLSVSELVVSLVWPQVLNGSWKVQTESGLTVNRSNGRVRHQDGDNVVFYEFAPPYLRAPVPEGSIKILVVGESFTFGWLLEHEHTYVNLLQMRVDEHFGPGVFALLNAASGSWGAADYVAFAEEVGVRIEPDILLVFLNTDDVGRALRSPLWSRDPANGELTRERVARQVLRSFVNSIPGYDWLLQHSHLVQLVRNAVRGPETRRRLSYQREQPIWLGPASDYDAEGVERGVELAESLFRRLSSWAERRNIELLVTTSGWHRPPYRRHDEPTEAFMSEAEDFFDDHSVSFWDPSAAVWERRRSDPEEFIVPGDGHPNAAGAALIAEHVFPFVELGLRRFCRETRRCAGRSGAS